MEFKDDRLKELLKLSKVDLPFDDFEDRVMHNIQRVRQDRHAIRLYRRNAALFFIIGTIFGFALNYLLTETLLKMDLKESLKNVFMLGSQMIYVLLVVLFSGALHKFVNWRKERT